MTMQDKNTATGELSYFETTLLFQIRYGFRGRVGVVSRSTARKTDGFLSESIATRRSGVQQIPHR